MTWRLLTLLSIAMIGEGVLAALTPQQYARLWKFGPSRYQDLVTQFVKRPRMVRCVAMVEVGVGLWLGLRQADERTRRSARRERI